MSEKLKIVLACDTFAPDINGAARFAERLAGGLARRGHDVHVVAAAFDRTHGTRFETHDGALITLHRVRSHRILNHKTLRWPEPWGIQKMVFKLLSDLKPTALHVQSHLLVGRFAIKAARRTGTKIIATNHVMPENLLRYSLLPKFTHKAAMSFFWKDARRILSRMDAVTTPTRRAAELLERAAGLQDVLAISCGIDATRFANASRTQNAEPVFLFLGRLDDEKRIHVLLKAVATLTDFPKVRVELVGDGGELENLKQLVNDLGIEHQVSFLGHISDADLPDAYERCTAFVMPSIAELQSIATMEAMASGRPVIGADAMALPHLVHDGDNGYLFRPDDHLDLAAKLRLVLEADQVELDRMSDNSVHLIQAHDINRTLDIFENLYRGEGEVMPTTSDNDPSYLLPIGILSQSVSERLAELRLEAYELRKRASELSSGARDRFEQVSQEAREQLGEIREEVKEQMDELKDTVKRQAKKIRKRLGQ
jgi:glycosyltransferase involved in cell wall biosynthesis